MPFRRNFDLKTDLSRGQAAVARELAVIGNDLIRFSIAYLDENKISFEGDLRKSIDKEVTSLVDTIKLQVFASARHAAPIHEGTRPHWPPRRPIENWARKKLKISETELRSAAYLISRKIAKFGTEAKPFFDAALSRIQSSIASRIEKAFIKGFDG